MARRIKFALEMRDGEQCRDMETLREHFDIESVMGYFVNGKLLTWLQDRYHEIEAKQLECLKESDANLERKLCDIFGVEYDGTVNTESLYNIRNRNERLERLKQFTASPEILYNVDLVAFDQHDLERIINEEETDTIYLCSNIFKFSPEILHKWNMKYIGIGKGVIAFIDSRVPVDFDGLRIVFENVQFDEEYIRLKSVEPDVPVKMLKLAEAPKIHHIQHQDNIRNKIVKKSVVDENDSLAEHIAVIPSVADMLQAKRQEKNRNNSTKRPLSYKKLNETCDWERMYQLGLNYIGKDKGKGIQYISTAASNEYFPAMKKLYEIYGQGINVRKDPNKANVWKNKMITLSKERADSWCRLSQYGKALEALKQAEYLGDKTIQQKIREIRSRIV